MAVLIYVGVVIWIIAVGLAAWGTWLSVRRFRSSPPFLDAPFGLYPVSILKPVKGREDVMETNLESFFRLDYPDYEIIFSVADPNDEAILVIQSLMTRYPSIRSSLLVGDVDLGPNPKVNNLVRSYEQAAHDWILISDSNVRVPASYLKRLVGHVDSGTGIITAVVAGQEGRGLGGRLESTYLNTFYARWMILAEKVGQPCVVGKSMLFRRSVANRFGGVKTLARYLAEDYMAGEAMRMLGLKVVIATDPVVQPVGAPGLSQFWSRHLRWGRIRKSQAPNVFLIEPFLGPVLSGFIGAYCISSLLGVSFFLVLSGHFAAWAWCDLRLIKQLEGRSPGWLDFFVWVTRELLHLPLWLQIALGNTVYWRGKRFRVLPGGILESV